MAVKDVNIRDEVAAKIDKGHGIASIPKDALEGFYRGLQKKYGLGKVADTTLASEPESRRNARRVVGSQASIVQRETPAAYNSEKVTQVLAHSTNNQTQYLISIDERLKEIENRLNISNQMQAKDSAQSNIVRLKQEQAMQKVTTPKIMPQQRGKQTGSLMNTAKDVFSIGNFLKYGASVAITGYDAYQGVSNSKEWGTNPLMGGLIGMLAGNKNGGALNAISKATTLGTIGGMLKGPVGAIIGTIVGGVAGFLGGDKLNGFIKDFMENKLGKIPKLIGQIIEEKHKNDDIVAQLSSDYGKFRVDNLFTDYFESTKATLTAGTKNIIADAEEAIGHVLKSIGLGSLGDSFLAKADTQRKESSQVLADASDAAKKRSEENDKQDADMRAKMKAATANTGYVHAATKVVSEAFNPQEPGDKPIQVATNHQKGIIKRAPTTAPEAVQQPQKAPTSTTPEPVKKDAASGSNDPLTVGEVPGNAIRAAVDAASAMKGVDGSIDGRVPPEALAVIVRKESSGKLNVPDGDSGTAVGITQIRPDALKDVNDNFGTNITQDQIRGDYRVALLTSALFMKLKLKQSGGNLRGAFSRYNGSGPMAENYGNDAMMKLISMKQNGPMVAPVAPQQKDSGRKILLASGQANQLQDMNDKNNSRAPAAAPIITSVNSVNTNNNMNLPMPDTRNDDQTYLRTFFG